MTTFHKLKDMTEGQLRFFGYNPWKTHSCVDCFVESALEVSATTIAEGDHHTTRMLCDRHAEKVRSTSGK